MIRSSRLTRFLIPLLGPPSPLRLILSPSLHCINSSYRSQSPSNHIISIPFFRAISSMYLPSHHLQFSNLRFSSCFTFSIACTMYCQLPFAPFSRNNIFSHDVLIRLFSFVRQFVPPEPKSPWLPCTVVCNKSGFSSDANLHLEYCTSTCRDGAENM